MISSRSWSFRAISAICKKEKEGPDAVYLLAVISSHHYFCTKEVHSFCWSVNFTVIVSYHSNLCQQIYCAEYCCFELWLSEKGQQASCMMQVSADAARLPTSIFMLPIEVLQSVYEQLSCKTLILLTSSGSVDSGRQIGRPLRRWSKLANALVSSDWHK